MGCDGMRYEGPALDFISKGAKAFVGWDGPISAEHTDAATENLLRHLVIDDMTIQQAVASTMREVGPDPTYESSLLVYPLEATD
jgi:hypothetical protein